MKYVACENFLKSFFKIYIYSFMLFVAVFFIYISFYNWWKLFYVKK